MLPLKARRHAGTQCSTIYMTPMRCRHPYLCTLTYLRMMESGLDVAVIGGGAAGYFAALAAARAGASVSIFEKTGKVLSKVAVSGGGRCNVTHDCSYPSQLVKHYPRGGKQLRKAFELFGQGHTVEWFAQRGVALKTEADGRMFPTTDDSRTIIDCLLNEADKLGVELRMHSTVATISPHSQPQSPSVDGYTLELASGQRIFCRKAIVTTGGSNKTEGYNFIRALGLKLEPPVPSLFTFNVPESDLKDLMGLSVSKAEVMIPGSKWRQDGPLLITHWGFSAPAVIKLSAWAAIELHARAYTFPILVNWTAQPEHTVRETLQAMRVSNPKKAVSKHALFDIPGRLWERLCEKAGASTAMRYAEMPAKIANRLVEILVRCPYEVRGKTTYKEEFVTCGGVALSEVDLAHFESKKHNGLYFAGEVLHVDGITGGFNFQHAWTSGYLSGRHAGLGAKKIQQ